MLERIGADVGLEERLNNPGLADPGEADDAYRFSRRPYKLPYAIYSRLYFEPGCISLGQDNRDAFTRDQAVVVVRRDIGPPTKRLPPTQRKSKPVLEPKLDARVPAEPLRELSAAVEVEMQIVVVFGLARLVPALHRGVR